MSGPGQTATTATVASSASSVNLFPPAGGGPSSGTAFPLPNGSIGRTVFNDSTQVLYLKFGATASASSYTVQIAAGGYYEFPQPIIWARSTGSGRRLTATRD